MCLPTRTQKLGGTCSFDSARSAVSAMSRATGFNRVTRLSESVITRNQTHQFHVPGSRVISQKKLSHQLNVLIINHTTGLQTSHHGNLRCQHMNTSRNMQYVSIGYNSAKQEVLFQNVLWLTCCGT